MTEPLSSRSRCLVPVPAGYDAGPLAARLRQDNLDPAEAADASDGRRRWGIHQWEQLDRTLGLVRSGLSGR